MKRPFDISQTHPLMQMMSIMNLLRRATINSVLSTNEIGSITQVATMGYLYLHQDKSVFQKDLESQFKLRRSTVSSMLQTLEKKGYLRRNPVDYDARLKQITLTSAGLDYCHQLQSFWDSIGFWMTKSLTPTEANTLESLLGKVQRSLEEEVPEAPDEGPNFWCPP